MYHSQTIFQKDLYQITREDLEKFFSEDQEENSILEFKEGMTDIVKIYAEVAAFLNTEGGLLILGAPREKEHPSKKGYKVASGSLTPCTIRDRDVILRGLGTGIAPSPTSIKIHEVPIEDGSVYILDIAQSMTPPHQVSNSGKYYIRLEREAKAAPHGIVEALFNKRQKPRLQISCSTALVEDSGELVVIFELKNTSLTTAESVGFMLTIYGASHITEKEGGLRFAFTRDKASCHDFSPSDILVKGIVRRMSFGIRPSVTHFLMSASGYCKDGELLTIWYLLSKRGEVVDRIVAAEEKVSINLYSKYKELNKRSIDSILGMSTEIVPAASQKDIDRIKRYFNGSVPRSYMDFLSIIGGFVGKVATTEAEIFPIGAILSSNNEFSPLPADNFLVFGKVGGIHKMAMRISKDLSLPQFGIIWNILPVNKGLNFQSYAYTLYELLELICHDKIPEIASYNKRI